jgi:hypothetical protein
MKTFFSLFLFFILFLANGPLSAKTSGKPVHLRPSADAPVIGHVGDAASLPAPAEAVHLTEDQQRAGWRAVSFRNDFRGFVKRNDLRKDLSIAPGTAVYLAASEEPTRILMRARGGDDIFVEQLAGEWAEVSFPGPVTAFVQVRAEAPPPAEKIETARIRDETATPVETPRRPIVSTRAGIPTDGVPRSFHGYLGQTRSILGRHPPYPFQIVDASGNRIAYLDLSRLLITTPMEHFLGREYEFHGRAEPIEGRRDFVIRVERMFRR